MSYYSHNRDRTPIGVLANAVDRQAKKMREHIVENGSMSSGIALRIARGQKFEELLGTETIEKFREELKENAKENAAMERSIQAYENATRVVCENANHAMTSISSNINNNNNNNNNESEADTKPHEFQKQIDVEYKKALDDIERNSAVATHDPIYAKVCRLLGEDEDQDDELAVVNDNETSLAEIKCPLTMVFMENPVKSSVCGHTFEKAAIFQHLKRGKKCPKAGCTNVRMIPDEFSEDPDTAMKVRRHKKREEVTKRVQARTAIDMDDDEDELQL